MANLSLEWRIKKYNQKRKRNGKKILYNSWKDRCQFSIKQHAYRIIDINSSLSHYNYPNEKFSISAIKMSFELNCELSKDCHYR